MKRFLPKQNRYSSGFTLMEIVVATTIFATVLTLMLSLLNYTLKINRRIESLRQVSQATRNFTEFLVREIRNGTIDYSGTIDSTRCPAGYSDDGSNTYLALVNRAGDRQCFYYLNDIAEEGNLYVTKQAINGVVVTEQVNPTNITIDSNSFRFWVRPLTNPKVSDGSNYPGIQPMVTMTMQLTARINNADAPAVIPYQTTVSTDVYDIPHY
jgi:prepilin-type N-terminal cleavage/methylation domain-containing protein